MRKNSQTSTCWKYFDKVEGGAKCKECGRVIAVFGNTSNLMKHLRRVHKNVLSSFTVQQKRKREISEESDETESEEIDHAEEEPSEAVAVAEANSAVHTIQAYRDVHGTTYLYLNPATEGEAGVQLQNAQFQPAVVSSESITANGEIVSVAVQKDTSILDDQAVDGSGKTQEEATPKKLVHAPVKNFQGSSVGTRTVVRHLTRPSPVPTAPPSKSNNSIKEDSYDAFGKYIASMLRNLPSKSACKLQGEIVNWILKEQIKNNDS